MLAAAALVVEAVVGRERRSDTDTRVDFLDKVVFALVLDRFPEVVAGSSGDLV